MKNMMCMSILILVMWVLTGCLQTSDGRETGIETVQQDVTIRYASWMAKGEDKPMIEAFMRQYPHVKVESEILDGTNYDTLIKTRLLSNNAPDVFMFMDSEYRPFVKQGWLMEVTNEPVVKQRQGSQVSDFFLYPRNENDDLGSFGANISSEILDPPVFYNRKLFMELGLEVPETLEQFYALCEKLKQAGIDPIALGIRDRWPIGQIMYAFRSTDLLGKYAELGAMMYAAKIWPSDVFVGSLTFLETLIRNAYFGKSSFNATYDQSVQSFVNGHAAMLPMGTWLPELDIVKNADPNRFELGAFSLPLPQTDNKIHVHANMGRNLGIAANSKYPEEARAFFNFFLDEKNLKPYLETQGLTTLEPSIEIRTNPVLDKYVASHQDTEKYAVHFPVHTTPRITVPTYIGNIMPEIWDRMIGGSTATQELAWLDMQYEQVKDNVQGEGLAANWNFNVDLDRQGWTRPRGEFTVRNGSLHLSTSNYVTGSIHSPDHLGIEGSNRYVRIRMKANSPEQESLLTFISTEDSVWDGKKTIVFETVPDVYQEYMLDMWTVEGWKEATIKQIIVRPFNVQGSASIDFISIAAE